MSRTLDRHTLQATIRRPDGSIDLDHYRRAAARDRATAAFHTGRAARGGLARLARALTGLVRRPTGTARQA